MRTQFLKLGFYFLILLIASMGSLKWILNQRSPTGEPEVSDYLRTIEMYSQIELDWNLEQIRLHLRESESPLAYSNPPVVLAEKGLFPGSWDVAYWRFNRYVIAIFLDRIEIQPSKMKCTGKQLLKIQD